MSNEKTPLSIAQNAQKAAKRQLELVISALDGQGIEANHRSQKEAFRDAETLVQYMDQQVAVLGGDGNPFVKSVSQDVPQPQMRPLHKKTARISLPIGQMVVGTVMRNLTRGWTHIEVAGLIGEDGAYTEVSPDQYNNVFFHINSVDQADQDEVKQTIAHAFSGEKPGIVCITFVAAAGRKEGQIAAAEASLTVWDDELDEALGEVVETAEEVTEGPMADSLAQLAESMPVLKTFKPQEEGVGVVDVRNARTGGTLKVEGYETVSYLRKGTHAVSDEIFDQMKKGETKVNFVATDQVGKKGMLIVKITGLAEAAVTEEMAEA